MKIIEAELDEEELEAYSDFNALIDNGSDISEATADIRSEYNNLSIMFFMFLQDQV